MILYIIIKYFCDQIEIYNTQTGIDKKLENFSFEKILMF